MSSRPAAASRAAWGGSAGPCGRPAHGAPPILPQRRTAMIRDDAAGSRRPCCMIQRRIAIAPIASSTIGSAMRACGMSRPRKRPRGRSYRAPGTPRRISCEPIPPLSPGSAAACRIAWLVGPLDWIGPYPVDAPRGSGRHRDGLHAEKGRPGDRESPLHPGARECAKPSCHHAPDRRSLKMRSPPAGNRRASEGPGGEPGEDALD